MVTASLSKSMSRTTHSPPSRSLDLRSFFLSRALMNFLAVFQLVFLIWRDAAWEGVNIGRKGRTRLEITRDWWIGKLRPL